MKRRASLYHNFVNTNALRLLSLSAPNNISYNISGEFVVNFDVNMYSELCGFNKLPYFIRSRKMTLEIITSFQSNILCILKITLDHCSSIQMYDSVCENGCIDSCYSFIKLILKR